MATLKVTTINLNTEVRGPLPFTVKLDAWKQTFYYHTFDASTEALFLDGLNLSDLSHDQPSGATRGSAGPLVLEFGGAFYKGRPILLDDLITFQPGKLGTEPKCTLLCIKQYFVEDRPGPDKMLTDDLPSNLSRQRIQRPRPVASSTGPVRPPVRVWEPGRPVRRGPADR